MPDQLNKIIKIKSLIENKNFLEAKYLLRSPLIDTQLKNLFEFQIAVIEEKTISKDNLEYYLEYKDNTIGETIHSLAGDYYFSKNKFGNAISQYHKCLEINPSNIHAMLGIANSLQSLGFNDLSEEKYREIRQYYTWKRDFYPQNPEMENDVEIKNPKKLVIDDFKFLPRDMLLNIGLAYDSIKSNDIINSESIFDYIVKTSSDDDFPESYIFVEENFQSNQSNSEMKLSQTSFIQKIGKLFPEFYKKYEHGISQGKYIRMKQNVQKILIESKQYEITCVIRKDFKIYSCIPKTIVMNEKIIAIFSLYLKNPERNLDKLLDAFKINYDLQYQKKEFLLECWLDLIKNKESIVYINKSKIQKLSNIDKNYKNKFIRSVINNQLTIKAINEQWPLIDEHSILDKIKGPENNYKIAKSLVDSLEDYKIFLNSKKEYELKSNLKFSDMISYLRREFSHIVIDLTKTDDGKIKNNKQRKKMRSQQIHFKELSKRLSFTNSGPTTSKMQKKSAHYN